MERNVRTISVSDEISEIESKIEEILEDAEDLDEDSEEYEDLDVQFKAQNIRKQNFEKFAEKFENPEFTIQELSFGELMMARDEVMSVSDRQNPREGLYQVKVLEKAVVDAPEELPDEPKDWPANLAEWVFDEVDAMNTGVSESSLQDFSLQEALENR